MPTLAQVITKINSDITTNGNEEITGLVLNSVLLDIVAQINDLTGELEDLNTDDVTSIVNAINSLKQELDDYINSQVGALTGNDDPNETVPVGFTGRVGTIYLKMITIGVQTTPESYWIYTGINDIGWLNLTADDTFKMVVVDHYEDLPAQGQTNRIYFVQDENNTYIWNVNIFPNDYVLVGGVVNGEYIDDTTFNDEFGSPVTPETGNLYLDTVTGKYYRWDGNYFLPIDQDTGGGGGISFITTTKANLDTLIANEELIPNALYEITGVQPALYGGTTIYLQAISTTELNPNGVGKFYNPKYNQAEQGFGIAVDYVYWADVGDQKPSGVYGVNDVVIWGGKHWTCIQPTTTSTKYIVDTFNLDTDYFVEIPFNETDYNVAYDAIKYDYENDWIVERNEKNSNIVSFDYEWLKFFECDISWIGECSNDPNDLIQVDPIKNFQWGNTYSSEDYVGIGFQRITNSVNQNINFRGSYQYNLSFDNGSRQYSITFDNGSRQSYLSFDNDSSQSSLSFDNSYQSYLTLDNNSHQSNLTFDNNSYQSYLSFDNGSYQSDLSFDNNSNQYNLTFDNSSQYNLTFDNSSSQSDLSFDNNSNQRNLTSSGSNRRQRYLTFNYFNSDRIGQPLNSNEEYLTFDNTVQNLPQYGQGNVTGTPAYILGVTSEGKVVETDGSDLIDWSNLTDKKHLRYDSSLGKPVDSNTSDTTTGISVDGRTDTDLVIEKAVNATGITTAYAIDLGAGAGNFNLTLSGATDFSFSNMIVEGQSCVFTMIINNPGENAFQFPIWLIERPDSEAASTKDEVVIHIHKGGVTPEGTYQIKNL